MHKNINTSVWPPRDLATVRHHLLMDRISGMSPVHTHNLFSCRLSSCSRHFNFKTFVNKTGVIFVCVTQGNTSKTLLPQHTTHVCLLSP